MTPGAYIQLRRRHAGLTRRRCADLLNGTPAASDATLQQLIHFEETSEMLPGFNLALFNLGPLLQLDRTLLEALALGLPAPAVCRDCGCTYTTPCITVTGQTCFWEELDQCSACAPAKTNTGQEPAASPRIPHSDPRAARQADLGELNTPVRKSCSGRNPACIPENKS